MEETKNQAEEIQNSAEVAAEVTEAAVETTSQVAVEAAEEAVNESKEEIDPVYGISRRQGMQSLGDDYGKKCYVKCILNLKKPQVIRCGLKDEFKNLIKFINK